MVILIDVLSVEGFMKGNNYIYLKNKGWEMDHDGEDIYTIPWKIRWMWPIVIKEQLNNVSKWDLRGALQIQELIDANS